MKSNPFAGALRSPCVSVCRMEPDTGFCAGCHRTIDEIADWGMMSDERKRSVWQQIRLRRGTPDPTVAPDPTLPPGLLQPARPSAPPHDGTPEPVQAHVQAVLPVPTCSPPPAVTPAPGEEGR